MNDTPFFPSRPRGHASAARIVLGVASLAVAWTIASAVHDDARSDRATAAPDASRDPIGCANCASAPTFHERFPLATDAAVAELPATF